jgi:hypothetical protein
LCGNSAFLGAFAKLREVTAGFVMSVLSVCLSGLPSAWNNSASTERIFTKFDIYVFFEKSVGKIQFSLKSDENKR